jgi:formyl-CoA transferase
LLAVGSASIDNAAAMTNSPGKRDHGPLSGVRVLDLSRVLAGPWAGQLLADYDADVIKVERPGRGDDTRQWGPPWLKDGGGTSTGDSAYFLAANRNKRSLAADLAHPKGAAIIRQLAVSADVVLENFRVGTAHRFGLDYESLRKLNPGLVYCSISAYGQTGSRSRQAGYDAMIQASGGLMSITGAPDEEGGSPQKVGVAIADIMAGMYAVTAILAALHRRETTGEGQRIDVPLYDSQIAWLANQNMNYLIGGVNPGRLGTAHPNLVPYRVFPTADGHIMLAVGNDAQFARCVECLGEAGLATNPDYANNAARVANREALEAALSEGFQRRTSADWLERLAEAGIPAGPINTIADVFNEPYAEERQLVRRVAHHSAGEIPTVANPVSFSETPVAYRLAPPELGEHTREILANELDYSSDEIDELERAGVI